MECKLRSAERRVHLVAVLCILSWRVFWITMMNRTAPDAPPDVAFTAKMDCLVFISTSRRDVLLLPAKRVYISNLSRSKFRSLWRGTGRDSVTHSRTFQRLQH